MNSNKPWFALTDIRLRDENNNNLNRSTPFRRPNTDFEYEQQNNRILEQNKQLLENASKYKLPGNKSSNNHQSRQTERTKAHKYLMKQGLILASVEKCALDEATNTQISGMYITKYENRFKLTQAKLEFRHHKNEYRK